MSHQISSREIDTYLTHTDTEMNPYTVDMRTAGLFSRKKPMTETQRAAKEDKHQRDLLNMGKKHQNQIDKVQARTNRVVELARKKMEKSDVKLENSTQELRDAELKLQRAQGIYDKANANHARLEHEHGEQRRIIGNNDRSSSASVSDTNSTWGNSSGSQGSRGSSRSHEHSGGWDSQSYSQDHRGGSTFGHHTQHGNGFGNSFGR